AEEVPAGGREARAGAGGAAVADEGAPGGRPAPGVVADPGRPGRGRAGAEPAARGAGTFRRGGQARRRVGEAGRGPARLVAEAARVADAAGPGLPEVEPVHRRRPRLPRGGGDGRTPDEVQRPRRQARPGAVAGAAGGGASETGR